MEFFPVLELVDVDVADSRSSQLNQCSSQSELLPQSICDRSDIGSRSDIQLQLQEWKFIFQYFIPITLHKLILFDDIPSPRVVIGSFPGSLFRAERRQW